MIQIRHRVFETNSSSCHCMVVLSEDEYKKYMKNRLWIDPWGQYENNKMTIEDIKEEQGVKRIKVGSVYESTDDTMYQPWYYNKQGFEENCHSENIKIVKAGDKYVLGAYSDMFSR